MFLQKVNKDEFMRDPLAVNKGDDELITSSALIRVIQKAIWMSKKKKKKDLVNLLWNGRFVFLQITYLLVAFQILNTRDWFLRLE